jgi:hypothetical protein
MKLDKIKITLILLIAALTVPVEAEDKKLDKNRVVDIRLQYAGNIGMVSAGIGLIDMNKDFHSYVFYGYLPESINGASVHTFGIKPSFKFASSKISHVADVNYYTGITLFYNNANNTYLSYPDYFQKGYYKQMAIRSSLFLGSRLNLNINNQTFSRVSLFGELGFLGSKLGDAILTKEIYLFEVMDISFGLAFTIN